MVSGPILIVGEAQRCIPLVRRVTGLGYTVDACGLEELTERVREGDGPSAVMLCAEGPRASEVMQELRGMRRGVSIPVTLCGRLGGAIHDLADVLDLGADQFLEEPFDDGALASTLTALAGTPPPPVPEPDSASTAITMESPQRTEVLDRSTGGDTEPHGHGPSRGMDSTIGRLGRTLDMLEDRLRSRTDASESSDELERSLLGLEPAPAVEVDPGASGTFVAELLTEAASASTEPGRERHRQEISPIESTTRLEGVPSTHAVASKRPAESEFTAHDPPPHHRPRRVSLSIERDGELADLDVPRMLWSLHESRYTGRVDLTQGEVRKQLWLEHGELVFARSSEPEDRLVNALVRRGLLTRAQYDAARSLAAKDPRRVGRLLVEAGFLKASALPEAIRTQVLGIVTSAFMWRRGRWSLEQDERCDEAIQLEESLARVLMHGVLDRLDTPQLEALVGGFEAYVRLGPTIRPEALALDLGLDASQRGLLTMLDGQRDLAQVCEGTTMSDRVVLATVYGLLVVGAAERSGEALGEAEAADAVALDQARIEERLRLVREADYFEMLGLPRDANAGDVRRARRELRAAFEDDAVEDAVREALASELDEIRTAIDDAAVLLTEDDLRLAYLAHLDVP